MDDGGFPTICASAALRDPAFNLFAPKLWMTTAFRDRAYVHERLDPDPTNEPREFVFARSSVSKREQLHHKSDLRALRFLYSGDARPRHTATDFSADSVSEGSASAGTFSWRQWAVRVLRPQTRTAFAVRFFAERREAK
jgi:hypothetical protein